VSDLLVAEGTHFASADEDRANRDALTQQGCAEGRAPPEAAGDISPHRKVVSLGHIFDVDNPRFAYRISGYRAMYRLAESDNSRERAMVSTDNELVAVGRPEHGIERTTHGTRGSHDHVEHYLQVAG